MPQNKPEKIRVVAFNVANKLYNRGLSRIKLNLTRWVFEKFVRPRMTKLIMEEIPIEEIKEVMWECKRDIDEVIKDFDIVQEFKQSMTDPVITKKVEQMPGFKKLLEMLD